MMTSKNTIGRLRQGPERTLTLPYVSQGRPLFSIASTVGLASATAQPLVALLPGRTCEWTAAYREHLAVGAGGEPGMLWLLRPAFAYGQDLQALTVMVRRMLAVSHRGLEEPTDIGFLDGSLYLGWPDLAIPLTEYVAHGARHGPRSVGAMCTDLAAGLDHLASFGLGHGFLSAAEICVPRSGRARLRGCAVLPPNASKWQPRSDDYRSFAEVLAGIVLGNLNLCTEVARARLLRRHPRLMMLQCALAGTMRTSYAALTHELLDA